MARKQSSSQTEVAAVKSVNPKRAVRSRKPKDSIDEPTEVTLGEVPTQTEKGVSPSNKLNDLTAKEWLPETISVLDATRSR